MTASVRDLGRVPGEDLGWPFAVGLSTVGVACALTCAFLLAQPAPVAPRPEAALAAAPVPRVVVVPPAAPTSAAPTGPAAPADCAPLVVSFAFASPNPPAATGPALATLAQWLTEHPSTTVLVNGHADSLGTEDQNLALSWRRARAVAFMLEHAGVARNRITARGFGAYQPVEGAPVEASANRRVLVIVRQGPPCPLPTEEVAAP